MDPSFKEVLEEVSLPENSTEVVELDGKRIALARTGGKVYALDNSCPHLGGPLGRGTLRDKTLICPLHHWTFSLESGNCLLGVAGQKVKTYETLVRDGKILVKMP